MSGTLDGFDFLLICVAMFCAGWCLGEKMHADRVDLHPSGHHRVIFHGEIRSVYLCEPVTRETDDED